jgi:proton-translocating NADH-quinone oxidoreductase chain M
MDMFYFYVFFEAILIPMFFLITLWGSRSRKIYAAYQLFIYTLLGSILMLFAFLTIYLNKGSASFDLVLYAPFFERRQLVLWILLFLGFSVKIPVVPFHLWLPEAHVEAPTTGSVILAGILLKLGTYAMLRFLFGAFSPVFVNLMFFILIIAFWGFLHSSLVAFTQIDIKKIIAYSSIAHMNFSLLGLFSLHILGLTGAFVMMFGHALTASALFLGIGILYDRYKTRLIFYYSSMAIFMPLFALAYFFFILSNFGFPGTVNFVGEFMISAGAFYATNVLTFFTTLGLVLTLVYSLFFYNRVFFGPIQMTFIRYYSDYTRLEFSIHLIFLVFIVYWGLYPSILWAFPFAKLYHLNYFCI